MLTIPSTNTSTLHYFKDGSKRTLAYTQSTSYSKPPPPFFIIHTKTRCHAQNLSCTLHLTKRISYAPKFNYVVKQY